MDESAWLTTNDPQQMLTVLDGSGPARKFRLFACACLRELWTKTPDRNVRRAVRFADGAVGAQEFRAAFVVAWPQGWEALRSEAARLIDGNIGPDVLGCARLARAVAARLACSGKSNVPDRSLQYWEWAVQANLLRDIFGNPFRPPSAEPSWLSANVCSIAGTIYDEQEFGDLPVLADALEEAGCTDADVLNHCRLRGTHARGCWVLDLLLDKTVGAAPSVG